MRALIIPLLATGLASASPPASTAPNADAEPDTALPEGTNTETVCRDTIHQVREANGQPRLDRNAASPDETYFIAAVDQRIDGCNVMVMRNDTSDVRPLPKPHDRAGLLPAN